MTSDAPVQTETPATTPTTTKKPIQDPQPAMQEDTPLPAAATSHSGDGGEEALSQEEKEVFGVVEDVPGLMEQGAQSFAVGNYADAVDQYGRALEILSAHYGPLAPELAESAYQCGRATLQYAIQQDSLLGGAEGQVLSAAEEEQVVAQTAKSANRFVFKGDAPELDQQEGPSGASGDAAEDGGEADDENDFAAAWENLDLARVLFEKMDTPEAKKRLGEVHFELGDVSLEGENFEQAGVDYTKAIEILAQCVSPDCRALAEAHWKLGLCFEFLKDFDKALENFETAQKVVERRIEALQKVCGDQEGKGKAVASDEYQHAQKELPEICALVPELKSKIEDLNTQMELKKKELKETMAAVIEAQQQQAGASSSSSAPVTDVSNLVKSKKGGSAAPSAPSSPTAGSKRKAEEEVKEEGDAVKKTKVEEQ
ncbi:hypothetical protein HK104_004027 [Borealophlyctis nickersoniae]|nr:hypothetical protein HK104_004027 [Borealophlyctis nickersoniae]